jgi:hypothetical protein
VNRWCGASPKLMAHVRDSARTYDKSDPIDALAVACVALREPDLPMARLDGVERELRLLVDHHEDLVGERTASLPLAVASARARSRLATAGQSWSATAYLTRHRPTLTASSCDQRCALGEHLASAHRRDHRPGHRDRLLVAGDRRLRTAAPHHYECGHRSNNGIACRAPGIAN